MTDINKHPLLRQVYELGLAIEECGASEKLTVASLKASALMEAIDKMVDDISNPLSTESLSRLATESHTALYALPYDIRGDISGHWAVHKRAYTDLMHGAYTLMNERKD